MAMKKISIIVPVFNTEKYLKYCLDSIKKQTLHDIEVLVIDDGSTDSSATICNEYSSDKRFKIFHNQNQGVSETRNWGIAHCQGEYCMFVDSDDWLDETMCEDMWNAAHIHNSDMVICGNYNESTAGTTKRNLYEGDTLFTGSSYTNAIAIHTLGLVDKEMANPSKLDKFTPVWARIYKTSIIKDNNVRFIDLQKLPSECLQFNFEFCIKAKSAFYLNKVLYHYRRNTVQSVTKPYRNDLMGKWLWWISYQKELLDKNSMSDTFYKAYYSRICCSIIPLGGNAIKKNNLKSRINECRLFLSNPIYKEAFRQFDYTASPIYWKFFFWSAKHELVLLFYAMTKTMRKILEKRKK